MTDNHKPSIHKTSEGPHTSSSEDHYNPKNLEILKDSDSTKNNNRTCFDEVIDALFTGLLGEVFLLIPFGLIAWIVIAWGSIWLLAPLVIITILLLNWLRNYKSQ